MAVGAYGWAAYFLFVRTMLYLVGFLVDFGVPKSIDAGEQLPVWQAVTIDVCLIAAFAIPHSAMARPAFKRWLSRHVPQAVERSSYVLVASLLLLLLFWQWKPLPFVLWKIEQSPLRDTVLVVFAAGWLLGLASSFLLGHLHLFGLRPALAYARNRNYEPPGLQTNGLYGVVRHPMYLGFLIGIWSTPTMTLGHLLFSSGMTLYLVVGMVFEEQKLLRRFGAAYVEYRSGVPAILPIGFPS